VIREIADDRHEALIEPDLLARFAQRRGRGAAVGGLDTAAGEADLPRVMAQLSGALREQHAEIRPLDERDEHRRRHRFLGEKPTPTLIARLEESRRHPVLTGVPRRRTGEPCTDDGSPVAVRRGWRFGLLGCLLRGARTPAGFSFLHRLLP